MRPNEDRPNAAGHTRRHFLRGTTTAALTGTLAANLARSGALHAAGSDPIRIGLVGCGGRGTGAAAQALAADENIKLVAMGDAFADRLASSLELLEKHEDVGHKVAVDGEHRFAGFDAFRRVIDSDIDVVLLCAPPHFRSLHLEAAVAAGKHIFAEKPVAVDAPGVRRVLAATEEAKRKNLMLVSGLCWRYNFIARAAMDQVHGDSIGPIRGMQCCYNSAGPGKRRVKQRDPSWSDMEWQLRNWYWFTWLSGDHIVEQAVHSIDKAAWAMRDEVPVAAEGTGGRQVRIEAEYGHIYDHFAISYEYAGGVRLNHYCRQQPGTDSDVSTHVFGATGACHIEKGIVRDARGETTWKYRGPQNVMHQTEHDELFAALRSGERINNGRYMATSTMMAILGRMAAYTGRRITWQQAMESTEDLRPPAYDWIPLEMPHVAMPGLTQFA